ncbi:MAG: VWA domain-containing protein [Acidobacteriota bacterium]|nr:VWA domain-containing protein [Acidobacteriota bacterium]
MSAQPTLHIYFLLDRSGSMASIADDVIGGFNSFLAAQIVDGNDAVMTLVQFDSQDPHEVLAEGLPLAEVTPLSASSFQPRGSTPLYDAMGHLIADAAIRAERLVATGSDPEEILVVIFTDGQENESREYDQKKVFDLIKKHEEKGWTFAYMGANQDSYAETDMIGVAPGSTQNYMADAPGTAAAYASLTHAVSVKRGKMRRGEKHDNRDLFEGDKGAEEDLRRRIGPPC